MCRCSRRSFSELASSSNSSEWLKVQEISLISLIHFKFSESMSTSSFSGVQPPVGRHGDQQETEGRACADIVDNCQWRHTSWPTAAAHADTANNLIQVLWLCYKMSWKLLSNVAPEIQFFGLEILPISGRLTKPYRNVTRHHILMRFPQFWWSDARPTSNIPQHSPWWDIPTLQDGGRQTGNSPHCVVNYYIEFHVDCDAFSGRLTL